MKVEKRSRGWLLHETATIQGVCFGFQGFQIEHGNSAAVDFENTFRLQARKIAGHELADGANLRSQFLIADGQADFHTRGGGLAFLLSQTQ